MHCLFRNRITKVCSIERKKERKLERKKKKERRKILQYNPRDEPRIRVPFALLRSGTRSYRLCMFSIAGSDAHGQLNPGGGHRQTAIVCYCLVTVDPHYAIAILWQSNGVAIRVSDVSVWLHTYFLPFARVLRSSLCPRPEFCEVFSEIWGGGDVRGKFRDIWGLNTRFDRAKKFRT